MKRRDTLLGLAALGCAPLRAFAQQKQLAVVGFLGPASATAYASWLDVMHARLRELGYVDGKNLRFVPRYGDGSFERLSEHAADLVRLKAHVIVTSSTDAALAAKRATTTIPIVTALISDPVDTGVVASLSRPGGNVTGTTFLLRELNGKRLELIKETLPQVRRVAVLLNAKSASSSKVMQVEDTARALKLQLVKMDVERPADLETRVAALAGKVDAVVINDDPLFNASASRIGQLVLQARLPAVGFDDRVAEGGALLAYAIDQHDMFRRAAGYVDKVLKGAKPADLPIERSSRFLLTVNQKVARALGLQVPTAVRIRADRVIE